MTAYIRNPLTYIWLFLSVVTVISWWLGVGHDGSAFQANGMITAAVLLFALIKTRFVIRNYMEVRSGPWWLQLACDAWLIGLFAMVSAFYWSSL